MAPIVGGLIAGVVFTKISVLKKRSKNRLKNQGAVSKTDQLGLPLSSRIIYCFWKNFLLKIQGSVTKIGQLDLQRSSLIDKGAFIFECNDASLF